MVAEIWHVVLMMTDKPQVVMLQRRRAKLGLDATAAGTLRAAVKLAMTASDEDLKRGEL